MIVWIIFLIISGILICFRLSKNFEVSFISLVCNIISCIISFILARACVTSFSSKCTDIILKFISDNYGQDLGSLVSVKEVATFVSSILIGIAMFYVFYLLISIIITIIKHIFIYSKINKVEDNKENIALKKFGIVLTNLISVALTIIVLVTPFGVTYNKTLCVVSSSSKEIPFSSERYFDLLTAMPNNNISASEEIKWTSEVALNFIDISNKKTASNIGISMSKTTFLPTVIADVGSTAAKHWKNSEEFLSYQYDVPKGREGKLYINLLSILENWDRETVNSDVSTITDLYNLFLEYGIDEIKEESGFVEALSDEQFIEDLFLILYNNHDFAKLIPITVEYGLGTAFDYIGLELSEDYTSNIDVSKLSQDDIKREARIVSGIIRTTLEVYETSQKLENGEISTQDIEKLVNEFSKLKDSKVLGDLANEIVFQLSNSISALQF